MINLTLFSLLRLPGLRGGGSLNPVRIEQKKSFMNLETFQRKKVLKRLCMGLAQGHELGPKLKVENKM